MLLGSKLSAPGEKVTIVQKLGANTRAMAIKVDAVRDYHEYVDGKLRYDGVRSVLASRGIELPEGEPSDPPSAETVRPVRPSW